MFKFIVSLLAGFVINVCVCQVSLETIDTNQAIWESTGINSYNMEWQLNVFLDICVTARKLVEVRNGEITSEEFANPDDPEILMYCNISTSRSALTIDTLFSILYDAYDEIENGSISALFDGTYGYPSFAYIDYRKSVADEELGWRIYSFEEVCNELTCDWLCDETYPTSPFGCSCDLDVHDGTCRENLCQVPNGCSQCMPGFFKLGYSYHCVNCQQAAGEHCMHCTDFGGCQQCQQGYTRVFDETKGCGFYYCKEDFCD